MVPFEGTHIGSTPITPSLRYYVNRLKQLVICGATTRERARSVGWNPIYFERLLGLSPGFIRGFPDKIGLMLLEVHFGVKTEELLCRHDSAEECAADVLDSLQKT